ncbi:hypothetical protein EG328_012032 [Venturia inaequalis]|uniref:Uncharacterized protein n=1 Tax=Venturia inaequalis TaxID=5025 RepID=A0A8H3Z0M2_VENIN|nr:hypothetical protein EG328_012032 [Venturia inaequalis]
MFFSKIILALSFSAGILAAPAAGQNSSNALSDISSDLAARNAIIARQPTEDAVNCSPEEKIKRGIDVNDDADQWYGTNC